MSTSPAFQRLAENLPQNVKDAQFKFPHRPASKAVADLGLEHYNKLQLHIARAADTALIRLNEFHALVNDPEFKGDQFYSFQQTQANPTIRKALNGVKNFLLEKGFPVEDTNFVVYKDGGSATPAAYFRKHNAIGLAPSSLKAIFNPKNSEDVVTIIFQVFHEAAHHIDSSIYENKTGMPLRVSRASGHYYDGGVFYHEAEVNYRNGGRYAHELLYPFSEHFANMKPWVKASETFAQLYAIHKFDPMWSEEHTPTFSKFVAKELDNALRAGQTRNRAEMAGGEADIPSSRSIGGIFAARGGSSRIERIVYGGIEESSYRDSLSAHYREELSGGTGDEASSDLTRVDSKREGPLNGDKRGTSERLGRMVSGAGPSSQGVAGRVRDRNASVPGSASLEREGGTKDGAIGVSDLLNKADRGRVENDASRLRADLYGDSTVPGSDSRISTGKDAGREGGSKRSADDGVQNPGIQAERVKSNNQAVKNDEELYADAGRKAVLDYLLASPVADLPVGTFALSGERRGGGAEFRVVGRYTRPSETRASPDVHNLLLGPCY